MREFHLNVTSSALQKNRNKERSSTKNTCKYILSTGCDATTVSQCHGEKEKIMCFLDPDLEPYLTSSNLFARQFRVCGQCLFPFQGWGAYLFHT